MRSFLFLFCFKAGHGAGWAGDEQTYLDQWQRMLDWYAQHFADEAEKKEN